MLDLNGQLLAVINAYIAFDSDSAKKAQTSVGNYSKDVNTVGDPMVRQDALNYANICYNGIIRQLILNLNVKPDDVILMDDLNYRNNLVGDALADNLSHFVFLVFFRTAVIYHIGDKKIPERP